MVMTHTYIYVDRGVPTRCIVKTKALAEFLKYMYFGYRFCLFSKFKIIILYEKI